MEDAILADAITTLGDVMRDRHDEEALSVLAALRDLVTERLETLDRNQELLLEAVGDLQWRVEVGPTRLVIRLTP
jgi:hypothetical protein